MPMDSICIRTWKRLNQYVDYKSHHKLRIEHKESDPSELTPDKNRNYHS